MAILSAILGGVTGVIGSVAKGYTEVKLRRLDMEAAISKATHETAMIREERMTMEAELKSKEIIVSQETDRDENVSSDKAFTKAMVVDERKFSDGLKANGWATGMMFILDFIRGIVRPGLTLYLCTITTVIAVWAYDTVNKTGIHPDDASKLLFIIVETVLYLTTTCVTFWFGTRNKQKPPNLN